MAQKAGASFLEQDVVDLYRYRPLYPQQVFDLIVDLSPGSDRMLDLGCGHGKIARPMSQHFNQVVAVDPSAKMIALGKTLPHGAASNLTWVEEYAEDVPLSGAFDTVVAALSIHWMNHERLFAKLSKHLKAQYLFAVVEGDEPHDPPWHEDWQAFLGKWVPKHTGKPLHTDKDRSLWETYLDHVEVRETYEIISDPIKQSVDAFILCQHSRDTFAFAKLGHHRDQFARELRALLLPFADQDGQLQFRTRTKLTTAII
ncbi:MAG: class I SAM-dependent methyltransferase [Pseudomonadota bacterium]